MQSATEHKACLHQPHTKPDSDTHCNSTTQSGSERDQSDKQTRALAPDLRESYFGRCVIIHLGIRRQIRKRFGPRFATNGNLPTFAELRQGPFVFPPPCRVGRRFRDSLVFRLARLSSFVPRFQNFLALRSRDGKARFPIVFL